MNIEYGYTRIKSWSYLLVMFMALFVASPADARVVEDVVVRQTDAGYEIRLSFFIPLRYQSHAPRSTGEDLRIQLRPGFGPGQNEAEILSELFGREALDWNRSTDVPIVEMIYEGRSPENPEITVRFDEVVTFEVRGGADLRSMVILLEMPEVDSAVSTSTESAELPIDELMQPLGTASPEVASLMETASQLMISGEYSRAVQQYTKVLGMVEGEDRRQAKELLAVARERNGQVAHAKAEYQDYLREFPEGPESDRVRQRLASLLTAGQLPREKLRLVKETRQQDGHWQHDIYGSLAQTYFRDEISREDEDRIVNRSNLSTSISANSRSRNADHEVRTQFVGSYDNDFETEAGKDSSELRINTATVGWRDDGRGIETRLGRQTRNQDGVFSRFDGVLTSIEVHPKIRLNGVFGYPVEQTRDTGIDTSRQFYAMSVGLGPFHENWDFNVYYTEQTLEGLTDRQAAGGEARFSDINKSMFTLLDYDLFYDDVNVFLLVGSIRPSPKTSFNLVIDYRNSPFLTTRNAVMGQGVEDITALYDRYSEAELFDLARDRTGKSKTATFGFARQLNAKYQLTADLTVSNLGATIASGGVEAQPDTGTDYFFSSQLIASNFFMDADIFTAGIQYADTQRNQTYSLIFNSRLPISQRLRINPRLRLDYRTSKDGGDQRILIRPYLRLDYRVRNWLQLELEAGVEFLEQDVLDGTDSSTGLLLFAGYRIDF